MAVTFAGDMLLGTSSKQKSPSLNSVEAEFIDYFYDFHGLNWLRQFAREWHINFRPSSDPAIPFPISQDQDKGNPLSIDIDNKDNSNVSTAGAKHINLAQHFRNLKLKPV